MEKDARFDEEGKRFASAGDEVFPQNKVHTLLDNRGDDTVLSALRRLLPEADALDVATGMFEVGSFLALDPDWQKVEKIRIIMGDETTKRMRQVLLDALRESSDESIEAAKEQDDRLVGLGALRQALESKKVQVRVYPKAKFHAKCYLIHTKPSQLVDWGLVGSSNFTEAGLTANLELNLVTTDQLHVEALRKWYEERWKESESAVPELLTVIDRHLRTYSPFEVWAKALYEYFAGREAPITEWEETESVVFHRLSRYQQDAYRQARAIAERWDGALLCDGVGLGKTYVGAMLLEYHLHQGHRVLILAPKSARPVWESRRRDDPMQLIREKYARLYRESVTLLNHTDLGRPDTIPEEDLNYFRQFVQAIIIDEGHHFRTPSAHRSKMLRDLLENGPVKRVYFLTATPINNSLRDLYHLIAYIVRGRQDRFASLGIRNLRSYFNEAEKQLERMLEERKDLDVQTAAQESDVLRNDQLLRALVIQRSRVYVKEYEAAGAAPIFPEREKPRVIEYSLREVYSGFFDDLAAAFHREQPLVSLALYNPEVYRKGEKDPRLLNRDKQVVGLIRTLLLKRLESSHVAFRSSMEDLIYKMGVFVNHYNPEGWQRWQRRYESQWREICERQAERRAGDGEAEEENDIEDIKVAELDGPPEEYDLGALTATVLEDMTLLMELNGRACASLSPDSDDKLRKLVARLRSDPLLREGKVVIFTEFRDTARYLWKQLTDVHGFADVEELDSTRDIDRERVIKRFAPYYNCTDDELPMYVKDQIRILVSTDVLSEGLNLQDANLIINYDLHWNPVRLMQRIGRIDRRLDPRVEMQLGRWSDEPPKVYVYNFVPPAELDIMLGLFQRVTGKLLRISKTLGIEAPVLTPEDDFEALRLLNERYEGHKSVEEQLHVELDEIRKRYPELYQQLAGFPRRLFSGKNAEGCTRGLFCCYRYPAMQEGAPPEVRWYFLRVESGEILESDRLAEIADAIRSTPKTGRVTRASADELREWRLRIERERVQRHMRDLQAPMGTKATLLCWMEVC